MCRARGGRGRLLVFWWLGRDLWDCQYVVNDAIWKSSILGHPSRFAPSISVNVPVLIWYVLLRLHVFGPCDPSHGSMVRTLNVQASLLVSSERYV